MEEINKKNDLLFKTIIKIGPQHNKARNFAGEVEKFYDKFIQVISFQIENIKALQQDRIEKSKKNDLRLKKKINDLTAEKEEQTKQLKSSLQEAKKCKANFVEKNSESAWYQRADAQEFNNKYHLERQELAKKIKAKKRKIRNFKKKHNESKQCLTACEQFQTYITQHANSIRSIQIPLTTDVEAKKALSQLSITIQPKVVIPQTPQPQNCKTI